MRCPTSSRPETPREPERCLVLRHVAFEGLGVLAPLLHDGDFTTRICEIGVDPFPAREIQSCDLLIVLGGPIGVYETDAYPWLSRRPRRLAKDCASKSPRWEFASARN